MEPQQPESNPVSYDAQSPYAPPLSAASDLVTPQAIKEYSSPFPFRLTFFAACIATVVTGLILYTGASGLFGGIAVYGCPFASVALFAGACMHHFEAVAPQRGRSHGKR